MLGGPGCQALEGKKGVHEAFAKFLGATACLQPDWGRLQTGHLQKRTSSMNKAKQPTASWGKTIVVQPLLNHQIQNCWQVNIFMPCKPYCKAYAHSWVNQNSLIGLICVNIYNEEFTTCSQEQNVNSFLLQVRFPRPWDVPTSRPLLIKFWSSSFYLQL